MRDGATLVKGVFPTIVNKVAGKPILPVARSPQSLVLENFFQGITDEQRAAANLAELSRQGKNEMVMGRGR